MSEGWIKLHRSISDNWLWNDKPFTRGQAFVDLLLDVNHADKKVLVSGQLIEVKAGEKITSLNALAERYGWTIKKVRNFLELLEKDQMIERKRAQHYTLIKVLNYGIYQAQDLDKRHTKGTQKAHKGQTEGTQRATNKNVKNEKNERNIITSERARESQRTTFMQSCPDVLMTDEQVESLLEQLSLEEFDTYFENLQKYIDDGHKVHNCYQTILEWAERDRQI